MCGMFRGLFLQTCNIHTHKQVYLYSEGVEMSSKRVANVIVMRNTHTHCFMLLVGWEISPL